MAMDIPDKGSAYLNANAIVVDGYNNAVTKGDEWLLKASNAIDALDLIYIEPISFSAEYDVDPFSPAFVRPPRPVTPTIGDVVTVLPDAPELEDVTIRDIGDAPEEPDLSSFLDYHPPAAPDTPLPVRPEEITPVLDEVFIPTRPTYVLPELPTLYDLQLVDFVPVVLPEFDGVRPLIDIDEPDGAAPDFTEQLYSSALLDSMRTVLDGMLQGGSGLPLAVEQAIFDRGRAREDRLSRKQVMEVTEDMAARGLVEPNGILGKRLREVHADNREKAAGLNRDLTIDTATKALEGVKTALAQGMVAEQFLIQQNNSINERALKLAIYVRDYGLQRINAMIAKANLEQQAYSTDAQVWKTRIEGALAALEQTKMEIDVQRLRGEFNKNLIEQYDTQYKALSTLAEFYKTDVEAAKVKGDINMQRIESAKLVLERYSTEVDAWGKVQSGYKTQVDAALGRAQFGEVLSNVFNTRMNGYKIKGDAYFSEGRFKIEKNGQTLDLLRAQLQRSDQDLKAQLAEIDSQLRLHQANVSLYEADGNLAQAESASFDRTANLKIESERNRTQVVLETARIRVDQMLKGVEILVEQLKGKLAAIAQLAASSQSGVNLGASIGANGSINSSWGVNWNGEAPDFSGPTSFT